VIGSDWKKTISSVCSDLLGILRADFLARTLIPGSYAYFEKVQYYFIFSQTSIKKKKKTTSTPLKPEFCYIGRDIKTADSFGRQTRKKFDISFVHLRYNKEAVDRKVKIFSSTAQKSFFQFFLVIPKS
jgi:hypothetical protein